MKKLQLLVLGVLLSSWGFAQESEKKSYSYNLDEAIAHALQYSSEAINADRDVQEARHKKWETTADGLPQIDGSVSYMNNIEVQKSPLPEAFGGGAEGFGTKHNMDAKLTLNQLLFSGSYLVALKASKTYQEYVQNNKLKTEADIREMVVNTYGNVLLVEESLRILNKNKTTVEANYNEMKAFFENGLTEEENVEQLEITLASIENTIKFNTKLKNTTYQMLKLTLGMELEDELVLTDSLESLAQKTQ
ncbi:MAG: TolC family protein [Flavobacteriales bacterium]|nr:TolC family protein [Flavobacteriales bacterium]